MLWVLLEYGPRSALDGAIYLQVISMNSKIGTLVLDEIRLHQMELDDERLADVEVEKVNARIARPDNRYNRGIGSGKRRCNGQLVDDIRVRIPRWGDKESFVGEEKW